MDQKKLEKLAKDAYEIVRDKGKIIKLVRMEKGERKKYTADKKEG